jgi:C4-type Zn-finger protein
MADMPPRKKQPPPPDGEPVKRRDDRDSTTRSRVSEVQDPEISGDVEPGPRSNSVEPAVDKAGQIIRRKDQVDELH